MQKSKSKFYTALVIFSLVGQIAWVVENMYFNVFIYQMFNASASDIATMVMASAISATLTTVLIGALSDKLGKRRVFISAGYVLWGFSILSFALIRQDIIGKLFPTVSASALCVTLVIVMDCVMTFFGSSANDACFNAWLTDVTDDSSRGKAEGINAMMPLVAILCVFGGFMSFDLSERSSWTTIFIIIGASVVVIGVLGFFLINEPKIKTDENQSYFKNIIYGFRPSVIKQNPILYLLLIAFAIFGISIQIFMPYLILYYTESLKMADYVLIMAPAIVLASVFTALWGRAYDKLGFGRSVVPSIALLMIGYLVLFFFRGTLLVFIGSLLMMCGYLAGMAVFGASIRDNTPENKSGMFQGLRIVAQVLIPGVVGPAIGEAILKDAELVTNDDGTTSFIPNEGIFMGALVVALVLSAFLVLLLFVTKKLKKPNLCKLSTPEGENYDENAWNEYPRPQLKRDSFFSLNGEWEFSEDYSEKILVPFPPESDMSGIGKAQKKGEKVYYRKKFTLPEGFSRDRVILNFGASDGATTVFLNGALLGINLNGYLPFSFDITEHLKGENVLELISEDMGKMLPYGKQRGKRGGMWYTDVSGIWQSVWLESVPSEYIKKIKIEPLENGVIIHTEGAKNGKITVKAPNGELEFELRESECKIELDNPERWSPENPYLYEFTIKTESDEVESYFAVRTLEIKEVDGVKRICLNGKPYFFHGLLDQGYFPEGIYTPASPKCLENDVLEMKSLGFNTLRKHIKIEHELFYYYCDKHGMVVFQDMVNNGTYSFLRDTALPTIGFKKRNDKRGRKDYLVFFEQAMVDTVSALYNHPCICYWTIYNEGWGQIDSQKMYEKMKTLDTSRIIDTASGWFKGAESDVESEHVYFKKVKLPSTDKPIVLSEFGGYSYKVAGHIFNPDNTYGYRFFKEQNKFEDALVSLYENEIAPLVQDGLCGAIYTQVSDVEDETNGLLTYDRKVLKVSRERMLAIAEKLKL